MAMENGPFVGDFLFETPISSGFPIATFDYQRVANSKIRCLGMVRMPYYGKDALVGPVLFFQSFSRNNLTIPGICMIPSGKLI